jgi:hypothetical protein
VFGAGLTGFRVHLYLQFLPRLLQLSQIGSGVMHCMYEVQYFLCVVSLQWILL